MLTVQICEYYIYFALNLLYLIISYDYRAYRAYQQTIVKLLPGTDPIPKVPGSSP